MADARHSEAALASCGDGDDCQARGGLPPRDWTGALNNCSMICYIPILLFPSLPYLICSRCIYLKINIDTILVIDKHIDLPSTETGVESLNRNDVRVISTP